MKLLLHVCCANCALYPVERLRREGWEVFGFWYNPNIHPYEEYRKRLEAVREIEEHLALRMIYQDRYELEDFLRSIVFRERNRCRVCYHRRLTAAARVARKGKFDAFTSTLLGSKLQQHDMVQEIGTMAGMEHGVQFRDIDFRSGWAAGREQSLKLGLYRQQYCGCIYSEKERFLKDREAGTRDQVSDIDLE